MGCFHRVSHVALQPSPSALLIPLGGALLLLSLKRSLWWKRLCGEVGAVRRLMGHRGVRALELPRVVDHSSTAADKVPTDKHAVSEGVDVMSRHPRAYIFACAVRLSLGSPPKGLVTSFTRTHHMQTSKLMIVKKLKSRIDATLLAGNITETAFDWQDFRVRHPDLSTGFKELVLEVNHAVVRSLLNLPSTVDLMLIREMFTVADTQWKSFFARPMVEKLLVLCGLREFAPEGSTLRRAHKFARALVAPSEWETLDGDDNFLGDCFAVGRANHDDVRGTLVEMLGAISSNISDIVSVIAWKATHGEDMVVTDAGTVPLMEALRTACEICIDMPDRDFVKPVSWTVNKEWARGLRVLQTIIHDALADRPIFYQSGRVDPESGTYSVVNLRELSRLKKLAATSEDGSDHASFGFGTYACPGEALALASLKLTLRILFSPSSKVQLGRGTSGCLARSVTAVTQKQDIVWSDDSIPLRDSRH